MLSMTTSIKGPIRLFGCKNVPMRRSRRRISAPVTKSPHFTHLDIPCNWNDKLSSTNVTPSTTDIQYMPATATANRGASIRRSNFVSDRTPKTSIDEDQVVSLQQAARQEISCPCLLHCKRSFSAPEIQRKLSRKKSNGNSLTSQLNSVSVGTQTEPIKNCLLYTSPSPRDGLLSRMPSSA